MYRTRILILLSILLLAAFVRIAGMISPDYNLDESWTYAISILAQAPDTSARLFQEPNNSLHIILLLPGLKFIGGKMGFRILGVLTGILVTAVVMRLGFRLYGRQAAWYAGFIAALSYAGISASQLGRPYIVSQLMGLLALLMWYERKNRLNMLFSALTPLFHVGAFPIVMIQDVIVAWYLLQRRNLRLVGYRGIADWIASRIPAYAMLAMILGLMFKWRLSGRVVSSGQQTPDLKTLVEEILQMLHGQGSLNNPSWTTLIWLILLVFLVIAIIMACRKSGFTRQMMIPLIWLALSFGILSIMTIIADGPIKFIHITHIVYAFALLFAFVLIKIPKVLQITFILLIALSNGLSIYNAYLHPFDQFTNSFTEIDNWRGDNPLYFKSVTAIYGLVFNAPPTANLDFLREFDPKNKDFTYPDTPYYYLAYSYFDDGLMPSECQPEPIWRYWEFHIHKCEP